MTTPLFLLRCTEVGISIRDLDLLTIGVVIDMWTEKANDGAGYGSSRSARSRRGDDVFVREATQHDFDVF